MSRKCSYVQFPFAPSSTLTQGMWHNFDEDTEDTHGKQFALSLRDLLQSEHYRLSPRITEATRIP